MAPYQAFAIGGLGSVRGYGEGAVGSGRSCLVANTELTFPLVCNYFIIIYRAFVLRICIWYFPTSIISDSCLMGMFNCNSATCSI